jgi:hypothetical protein
MTSKYMGLLAALLLGFVALTVNASAQNGTQSVRIPAAGATYNPCCDDWIELTGTFHITTKTTVNKDGTITYDYRQNSSDVKGTGSSTGANYTFTNNGSTSTTVDPNSPAASQQAKFTYRYTAKGRDGHDCSGTATLTINFVVDSNGNLVANDFSYTWDCTNGNTIN